MTPSLSRKVKNLTFPKGFVRMSATCSSVLMCWSLITPCCTISRIKWYLISMCLERSWNTGFSDRRIPLWLSQMIMMVSNMCSNSSLKSFLNQTASQQALMVLKPIFASCSSKILKQTPKRSNTQTCSYDPPHWQPNQHLNIHVASFPAVYLNP